MIIGIGGPTSSGKTTLSSALFDYFMVRGVPTVLIHQDNYWVDLNLKSWEDPCCIRLEDFESDIIRFSKTNLVIAEGFLIYSLPRELFDIAFFLEVPVSIMKIRRSMRTDWDCWTDPPNYFETEVVPKYRRWNQHVFDSKEKYIFLDGTQRPEQVFETALKSLPTAAVIASRVGLRRLTSVGES